MMTSTLDQKLDGLVTQAEALVAKHSQLLTENKALQTSCQQLEEEKKMMQSKHERWLAERARLIQCNDLARSQLQSVLGRLKSIEHFA